MTYGFFTQSDRDALNYLMERCGDSSLVMRHTQLGVSICGNNTYHASFGSNVAAAIFNFIKDNKVQ